MDARPTVAIVGRPNVGKSTLFNRLVGRRQAIVHDRPGVTRDRISAPVELGGERRAELIDTGGLVPGGEPVGPNQQVLRAIEASAVVLFVVDGKAGLLPGDLAVAEALRPLGKPTVLVINKGDVRAARDGYGEFYELGFEPLLLVSAEHGGGIEELREEIRRLLPASGEGPAQEGEAAAVRLALVGRPNVGKSSLLNRLLGEERVVVSAEPGTTRDPVDTLVDHAGRRFLLVDTAGIRRRGRGQDAPEDIAILLARRQIERAEVAVLVLDATAGVTGGDLAIAGIVWELGRAAVVAVNKWDLLDGTARERLERHWPRLAQLLAAPTRLNLSAKTGRNVDELLPAAERVAAAFHREVPTAELNELLAAAVREHHAPTAAGRPWKLYYATQVATGPPTFLLFANRTLPPPSGYRTYLEHRLRDRLGLSGIPIRLVVRRR